MLRCESAMAVVACLIGAGVSHAQTPEPGRSPHSLATLAELAADSNRWMPVCDPPAPTKGLWDNCERSIWCRSWQEHWFAIRDGLGWLLVRPKCYGDEPRGLHALAPWLPSWGGRPACGPCSGVIPCTACPD
jgi:hypothetical protein